MFKQTVLAMAAIAIVAVGCNSGGDGIRVGPGMTYKSTNEKQDCKAVVKDGKLTWSAKAVNELAKRGYSRGLICLHTNVGNVVDIEFETSIEANTTVDVGENDVVIGGMPKDWQVVNKNVMIVPGAGCETPTTRIAANWPVTPFKATYKASPIQVKAEKDLAPLDVDIKNLESVTTNHKLVVATFDLINNSKAEVTCKVVVTTKTNDGRTDSRNFEYSLLPGEEKKGIKCDLGFSKPFVTSETSIHIDGKEKATRKSSKSSKQS